MSASSRPWAWRCLPPKPYDAMFIAEAVAEEGTEENLAVGMIYPPESRILDVSLYASERIATFIFDQVLARIPRRTDVGELIRALAHRPVFAGDAK